VLTETKHPVLPAELTGTQHRCVPAGFRKYHSEKQNMYCCPILLSYCKIYTSCTIYSCKICLKYMETNNIFTPPYFVRSLMKGRKIDIIEYRRK